MRNKALYQQLSIRGSAVIAAHCVISDINNRIIASDTLTEQ
jgi:hypothetical protein